MICETLLLGFLTVCVNMQGTTKDYLYEVYKRTPTKIDSTGDFTWKDKKAADRMGLSLEDYVIGGMSERFAEALAKAGKAMDEAGINWSILSGFRDDYRQQIADGFKARTGYSLHGGSYRTGGYGHGAAADIVGATDDETEKVWHWIDENGSKFGLTRPMKSADPAHVQLEGYESHHIAKHHRNHRHKTKVASNHHHHKHRRG